MVKVPTLSVVYPNLNGDKTELKTLLTSLKRSTYPQKNLGVIMVDNDSSNDSPDFVAKHFPWVKIIKLKKNYGFSKAVNIGIKGSGARYIFVTNDDVKLEKNCLTNIVNHFLKNPNVGIIGCRVYDFASPQKIVSSALKYNYFTGRFSQSQNISQIQEVDWVAGSGIAFPKALWKKLHGYDEDFFFSSEETDLCLRAKYAGYKVVYLPQAIFWHGGSTTIHRPEYIDFFRKQLYRGKIRLILKHGRFIEIISAIFVQFLVAVYNSFKTNGRDLVAFLDSVIWNFKNLPKNISSARKSIST